MTTLSLSTPPEPLFKSSFGILEELIQYCKWAGEKSEFTSSSFVIPVSSPET